MTRAEATERWLKMTNFPKRPIEELDDFIEEIFDDFENRTCKNCKYSELASNTYWCNLMKLNFTLDFGCSLFEKK